MPGAFALLRHFSDTDAQDDNWGLKPARVPALGITRFPAGARLRIRGGKSVAVPAAMATAADDRLRIAPGPAATEPLANGLPATSLDQVIAQHAGSLAGTVGNGNTTLCVWSFTEAPADPAHTDRVEIRVAFDAHGNKARFTRNNRLPHNRFSTNERTPLDTAYTVEQMGDLRLLNRGSRTRCQPADRTGHCA